jgi:hypothetical protein
MAFRLAKRVFARWSGPGIDTPGPVPNCERGTCARRSRVPFARCRAAANLFRQPQKKIPRGSRLAGSFTPSIWLSARESRAAAAPRCW